MSQLAKIRLIVSPSLTLQAPLDGLSGSRKPFQGVVERLETLRGAVAGHKRLHPCLYEGVIGCRLCGTKISWQDGHFPAPDWV